MEETNTAFSEIDAIAVCKGPGSYTGLRIGVSTAKGLGYAIDKPLIAIDSLQAMAHFVSTNESILPKTFVKNNALFCPMIDAKRMEVYTAFYDADNKPTKNISADVIDKNSYFNELDNRPIVFFGNGAKKCQDIIKHHNALFINSIQTSASYMTSIAEAKFCQKDFVDIAYFEPFYLKNFIATVPKKNIYT